MAISRERINSRIADKQAELKKEYAELNKLSAEHREALNKVAELFRVKTEISRRIEGLESAIAVLQEIER